MKRPQQVAMSFPEPHGQLVSIVISYSFGGGATKTQTYRTPFLSHREAPMGIGPLTVAFGDVQRNRLQGTQQLVPRGPIAALQAMAIWYVHVTYRIETR
jgi:hypothetical protein